jgi:hypothetical protein
VPLTEYSEITILILMTEELPLKPVVRVGSTRDDLRAFPDPVQDHMGYAIYVAQRGGKHRDAKALSGLAGQGCWKWSRIFAVTHFAQCIRFDTPGPFTCSTRFRKNRRQGARHRGGI